MHDSVVRFLCAALTEIQLVGLCPTIHSAFAHHTDVRCRVAYYDLLAWLYEYRPDTDAALRSTWRVRFSILVYTPLVHVSNCVDP